MVEVKRSPAKVSWQLIWNGSVLAVMNTRQAAEAEADKLNRKYAAVL